MNEYSLNKGILLKGLRKALFNAASSVVPVGVINELAEYVIDNIEEECLDYDLNFYIPQSVEATWDTREDAYVSKITKLEEEIKNLKKMVLQKTSPHPPCSPKKNKKSR